MKRLSKNNHTVSIIFISLSFVISGCNEEKAQALMNAAEVFKNESRKAILAYEELLLAGLDSPQLSEKEIIVAIVDKAKEYKNKNKKIEYANIIKGTLQDPLQSARIDVKALVQRQSFIYETFSDALTNLKRGSYFSSEPVSCAEEMARRLVINIANYKEAIKKHPISLVVPEENASMVLEDAVKNGTESDQKDAARTIYELYNKKEDLNNKVATQAVIAAEAGLKVINAAENYDKLSIDDLLNLLNKALNIAGSIEGIDTTKALTKLDQLSSDAKGDEHWQRILNMEIYSEGTTCNTQN